MKEFEENFKILLGFVDKVIFLATADQKGNPNLIAVELSSVTPKGEIIITNNHIKRSIKNLKENEKCVLLITDNQKMYWRIFGTARHEKGKWLEFVKNLKSNKGCKPKGAIVFRIKSIDDLDTDTGGKNI